jgi:hypothetical protein
VIEQFKVEPGPEVGQILERARTLYQAVPCSRETLIQKLRDNISDLLPYPKDGDEHGD